MNKTYRLSYYLIVISGGQRHYRLNRSCPHRKTKQILGKTLSKLPINFFIKGDSRRNTFHYKEDYVQIQNHLWKFNHGKFRNIARRYNPVVLTETYWRSRKEDVN